MKRISLLFSIIVSLYAFQEHPPFEEEISDRFYNLFQKYPKEKLYLHTDKDIYIAGDTVWFRSYMVNAFTNIPILLSRLIYVELSDKRDSVIQRLKFREWDSTFYGNINLPENIKQGDYCIRAFTYWMQNEGTDYFFKKNIRVVNPHEARINTEVKYIRQENGRLTAEIRLSNAMNIVYNKQMFIYQVNKQNQAGKIRSARTDDNGILRVQLQPDDRIIYLSTKDDSSIECDRYLYIPKEVTDFDVQFFPEGGNLLSNNYQRVAFKAIDSNGLSTAIEGTVYLDSMPTVLIKSEHKGMGSFKLPAYTNKHYYAEITNKDGITKRFALPPVVSEGIGIQLASKDSCIYYTIITANNSRFPDGLSLLMQCRGQLLNLIPINARHKKGKITISSLPEGIIQAVLVDSSFKVYSERLFFIRPGKQTNVDIRTDKETFGPREKINLRLLLDSNATRGSFSMAVVKDSGLDTTSYNDNIHSNLLMTSDLKGYIEEPGYYFSDTTEEINRHLDLVMLTHGWTRFNVADLEKNQSPIMNFYLELGQAITGKVKNVWGKASEKANLLFISDKGSITMTTTDSTGYFSNNQLFFTDGTKFVVRATNQKGKKRVEIHFDKDSFLTVSNFFPYNEKIMREEEEFYDKFNQNYYYENGEKVYLLNEVKVNRKAPLKKYSKYDSWADDLYRLDSARIANDPEENIVKLIARKIPGLMVYNEQLCAIGPFPPRAIPVALNGFMERSYTFINMIPKRYFLGVTLLTGSIAKNSFGEDSVLLITTQPDYHFEKPSNQININRIRPMGIRIPDEFYVPKYEIDSIRNAPEKDKRVTLFWDPVITLDPGKTTALSCYTNDKPGTYSIIVEGITSDGKTVRKIKKIKLK